MGNRFQGRIRPAKRAWLLCANPDFWRRGIQVSRKDATSRQRTQRNQKPTWLFALSPSLCYLRYLADEKLPDPRPVGVDNHPFLSRSSIFYSSRRFIVVGRK